MTDSNKSQSHTSGTPHTNETSHAPTHVNRDIDPVDTNKQAAEEVEYKTDTILEDDPYRESDVRDSKQKDSGQKQTKS